MTANFKNIKLQYSKLYKILEDSSILIIIIFFVAYSLLSIPQLHNYYWILNIFGIFFIIEYLTRIFVAEIKLKYIFSFLGLVDLLSAIAIFFPFLFAFRILRLLKLIRLLDYITIRAPNTIEILVEAVSNVKTLLIGYLLFSLILIYVSSTVIYYFEYQVQPDVFTSIFNTMWWCIITLTTVGYGDMIPITTFGKIFTSFLLLIGVGIIAIPTALIASSLVEVQQVHKKRKEQKTKAKNIK